MGACGRRRRRPPELRWRSCRGGRFLSIFRGIGTDPDRKMGWKWWWMKKIRIGGTVWKLWGIGRRSWGGRCCGWWGEIVELFILLSHPMMFLILHFLCDSLGCFFSSNFNGGLSEWKYVQSLFVDYEIFGYQTNKKVTFSMEQFIWIHGCWLLERDTFLIPCWWLS